MNEEKLIRMVESITRKEMGRKFPVLEREEMVSEAFYWLAQPGRIARILERHSACAGNPDGMIASYIRSSLSNIFNRAAMEQAIRLSEERADDPLVKGGAIPFSRFRELLTLERAATLLEMPEVKAKLTTLQYGAVKRTYVDGASVAELAEELGISKRAVYDRLKKGLRRAYLIAGQSL